MRDDPGMPEPANFQQPEWDVDMPDAPFGGRLMQLAARAGAQTLGASLYEIDPGGGASPYHVHHANEELLLVLSGTPSVRTPAGIRELEAGDVVAFPAGPDGAHRILNPSDAPARVIVVSQMNFPEVAEHPDTGTTLTLTAPAEGKALAADGEIDVMQAVTRAAELALEHERGAS